MRLEQLERQREVLILYFKVYLRKIQGKREKSVNAQSFTSLVKPVPTLQFILRILSSTYIGHLFPHSYQLIGWPFALESVSRIGLCLKILGYTIWTLAQWSNEGCIVCESELSFFLFFFSLTASPGSGMCLAFNQKQHCTPDQSVHTRAALCSSDAIISKTSISYMKYKNISLFLVCRYLTD